MKRIIRRFYFPALLLCAFLLWTLLVCTVDVRPIGPKDSGVGMATVNDWFHTLTGVHMTLYTITDWLSLIPLLLILCFAVLGLSQWIRRKALRKVDPSILILGGFYLAVMAAYLFFETVVINYRPVLIGGILEASYPSSTTMLVMTVIPTAVMQLENRLRCKPLRYLVSGTLIAFTLFMVIARLISGVHWLTDIIGGALLSAGLVTMYDSFTRP